MAEMAGISQKTQFLRIHERNVIIEQNYKNRLNMSEMVLMVHFNFLRHIFLMRQNRQIMSTGCADIWPLLNENNYGAREI